MVRSKKRYLLVEVGGGGNDEVRAKLGRILGEGRGAVTLIPVRGCEGYLIVKTTPAGAAGVRDCLSAVEIGGKKVISLRTSGCIGKLKRLANERAASEVVKVPKR